MRIISPEQISNGLEIDFPEDGSMRISHETIYRALYIQGRGALRRELTACRICADLDAQVAGFADRDLSETTFPYVFLDAT